MKWFRGGLVFNAHRLFVSLNSRLESNKEEEEDWADLGGSLELGRGHLVPILVDQLERPAAQHVSYRRESETVASASVGRSQDVCKGTRFPRLRKKKKTTGQAPGGLKSTEDSRAFKKKRITRKKINRFRWQSFVAPYPPRVLLFLAADLLEASVVPAATSKHLTFQTCEVGTKP